MYFFLRITCRCHRLQTSLLLLIFVLLWSAVSLEPVWGQPRGIREGEVIRLAPPITPGIWMARALKKNDQVIVQVSAPETRIRKKPPGEKDAKAWVVCWSELDPLVLGKQIRAYNTSGEKLGEEELLKALQKEVVVACFQRSHKDDPELPDPFYAKAFHKNVVMLVFEAKYWLRD